MAVFYSDPEQNSQLGEKEGRGLGRKKGGGGRERAGGKAWCCLDGEASRF